MDMKAFDFWVRKTIHNKKIDYIRKRKRIYEREVSLEYEDTGWQDEYFVSQLNIGNITVEIKDDWLYQCVNTLNERKREIILLYYFAGYRDANIGFMLEIPKSSVNYNRNRALRELKGLLRGEDIC